MKNLKVLVTLIITVLMMVSCSKDNADSSAQYSDMPQMLVSATKSIKMDIPWNIEYPAQVAGSLDVEIRAQVGGILKERLYNEGEYVQKGKILFTIAPEEYKASLEKAEASLAQVNTEVQRTKRDFDRMAELIKDNAVSQKDYDDSLSAYEQAQANYKAARAVVDEAQINFNYTKVRAPISGIARKENRSVGSLISVMGGDSLLTTMVQINPLHVNFSIPSIQLTNLGKQLEEQKIKLEEVFADIILPDNSIYKDKGKIIFFDSVEDMNTASFAVKLEVPNPKYEMILSPGQFVKVVLKGIVFNNAVLIPQSAVNTLPTGENVVCVINTSSNNVVEAKPVDVVIKDSMAIVLEGLEGGELVVSAGNIKVRPGMPVNYEEKEFVLPEPYLSAYKKQNPSLALSTGTANANTNTAGTTLSSTNTVVSK